MQELRQKCLLTLDFHYSCQLPRKLSTRSVFVHGHLAQHTDLVGCLSTVLLRLSSLLLHFLLCLLLLFSCVLVFQHSCCLSCWRFMLSVYAVCLCCPPSLCLSLLVRFWFYSWYSLIVADAAKGHQSQYQNEHARPEKQRACHVRTAQAVASRGCGGHVQARNQLTMSHHPPGVLTFYHLVRLPLSAQFVSVALSLCCSPSIPQPLYLSARPSLSLSSFSLSLFLSLSVTPLSLGLSIPQPLYPSASLSFR